MPLYEYQCNACGTNVDIRHGMKEKPTDACAACGGELRRVFRPAGIVFKGSGFYVTDSRKSSGKAERSSGDAKPSEPKAENKSEPSGEKKSESKPSDTAA